MAQAWVEEVWGRGSTRRIEIGVPENWVGVWVCGCVGVWVCGCVGVWVCGCVGVWVCGLCGLSPLISKPELGTISPLIRVW